MENFWQTLKRPFFALAPMEDVTDAAFRALIARHGKPDVFFTEFTSADGLMFADDAGQKKLRRKLAFSPVEKPIVAQIFSAHPGRMEAAARLAADMGFDGIDINMGCPVDAVVRNGSGAALIKTPSLARELIRAAQRGWCASQTCTNEQHPPVSVKTRIGFNHDELETWLPEILAEHPAAVTIHARTRKEMSKVPARWEHVARAVKIRNEFAPNTLLAGNGDVRDLRDAHAKINETGCDGVMIGRAIYGNPWLFSGRLDAPTPKEKVDALLEHLALFEELLSDTNGFPGMKKHFKAYISGWDGAKELRIRLMDIDTVEDARAILASAILPA